jgi:hypothetical protein
MKIRPTIFAMLLMGFGCFASATFGQQDDDVRGAFLTSRPKTENKSAPSSRPNRHRPKSTVAKPVGSPQPTTAMNNAVVVSGPAKPLGRLGIGLTLFTRDANGLTVRVDPSHEFHKGDRVRFLMETNADGFLYIFNTTDGGAPVLIYPDPALDEGGNFIQAHVPVELPSSAATEERLKWLTFDEHAGAERLYLVFTREPLATVPIDEDLVNYCRARETNCPLRPPAELWAQIQKELAVPVQVAKTQVYGRPQTVTEHDATTRGIGLSKSDPEPAVIMLTASTASNMLVTTVDLIHR